MAGAGRQPQREQVRAAMMGELLTQRRFTQISFWLLVFLNLPQIVVITIYSIRYAHKFNSCDRVRLEARRECRPQRRGLRRSTGVCACGRELISFDRLSCACAATQSVAGDVRRAPSHVDRHRLSAAHRTAPLASAQRELSAHDRLVQSRRIRRFHLGKFLVRTNLALLVAAPLSYLPHR